jgi:hypothetical protein
MRELVICTLRLIVLGWVNLEWNWRNIQRDHSADLCVYSTTKIFYRNMSWRGVRDWWLRRVHWRVCEHGNETSELKKIEN